MFVTLCLLSLIIADNTAIAHLKVGRCCSIFGCLYRDKWNSWGSLCLPERHMAWVASVQLSSFPWENQGVRYTSSSPSHHTQALFQTVLFGPGWIQVSLTTDTVDCHMPALCLCCELIQTELWLFGLPKCICLMMSVSSMRNAKRRTGWKTMS